MSYEDFQCSFCRQFNEDTAALLEEFVETGIASIEYRHLAFLGDESVRAAEASECAADQELFWDYHDILFLRQGAENDGVFATGNLKDFARELAEARPERDFDLDAFDSCLDSGVKEPLVNLATSEASSFFQSLTGRVSTPSFLINGQPLQGALSIEVFREAIVSAQSAAGS